MKQRTLCSLLAAMSFSVTGAAAEPTRMAQAVPTMLPAYEIATIVRSAGFIPLSPAMRRGNSYVLRAEGPDGREMRVIVHARRGEIISAVPVIAAARGGPPGERLGPYERMGPYEPVGPDGYVPPGRVGARESGPPVVYEGDRPLIYERRPAEPIPNVPPRSTRAAIPAAPEANTGATRSEQQTIMTPERGEHGLLPPPPDRFPQRAAPPAAKPAAKPAPVKRTAAAPPATPPLPKPKPVEQAGSSPAADASPAPQPVPESKPDPRALPH